MGLTSAELADIATIALPVLVLVILALLFLVIPLANFVRHVRRLHRQAYPLRLGHSLLKAEHAGVGQPLPHDEDDDDDEEQGYEKRAKDNGEEEEEEQGGGRPIYLDWNGTTPIFPQVTLEMLPWVYTHCGNPGSSHRYGQRARAAVELARGRVAATVGCAPEEIYFTSCGTEALNWAVRAGVAAGAARRSRRPHVITSAVEHPAVLEPLRRMQREGAIDLTVVSVCAEGFVRVEEVAAAFEDNTALVAVMHANNEVGSLQPIPEIAFLCRARGALLLVDCAQSVGKVPVDVNELQADMVSIVAHKFGGPKGVAALYVRQGVEIEPLLLGGGQERGLRSGTENVLLIAGLGKAAEIAGREQQELAHHMDACSTLLRERLVAELGGQEGLRFNGPRNPHRRLPNTTSVSFDGLLGHELVAALANTVALSAGSACHAHDRARASAVLEAMQVPPAYALGTLRVSVGRHTTLEEVRRAARLIAAAVKKARRRARQGEREGSGTVEQQQEEEEEEAPSKARPVETP